MEDMQEEGEHCSIQALSAGEGVVHQRPDLTNVEPCVNRHGYASHMASS